MKKKPIITIGTMIETPRAAIRADETRRGVRLLQLRDERPHTAHVRVQPRRRRESDDAGVPRAGAARSGTRSTRSTRAASATSSGSASSAVGTTKPDLKLGVCGEHGGDPESIDLFYRGRARLRVVQPVPGADRPAQRSAGDRCTTPDRPARVIRLRDDVRHDGDGDLPIVHSVIVARHETRAVRTSSTSTSPPGSGAPSSRSSCVMLLVDLLVVHKEAHEVSTKEAAIESVVWISGRCRVHRRGGVVVRRAGERGVHLGLPDREEAQRRQRLRVGADHGLLRGAAALSASCAVLGHLRCAGAARRVHLRRRRADRAVRLDPVRVRRRSCSTRRASSSSPTTTTSIRATRSS